MDPRAAQQLTEINRRFYSAHGDSFAATRRRIQPGVRRILDSLPDSHGERWLDLGCGSGALAAEWILAGRQSAYHGLDFSPTLLDAARREVAQIAGDRPTANINFGQADLTVPGWVEGLAPGYAGALAFAVLHHLPDHDRRVAFALRVRDLIVPGGRFFFSVWQFQHSEKLMARRLPWSAVGLRDDELEQGDTLLDWRAEGNARAGAEPALRYVHLFSREELTLLARESGFRPLEEFESDGHGGRLGLYLGWQVI